MGSEQTCHASYQNREGRGTALLETDEVIFRSDDLRFTIPFASITSTEVRKDHLVLTTPDGVAVLDLGPQADVWAGKITRPKTLEEKLGLKGGVTARMVGVEPEGFRDQVSAAGAKVTAGDDMSADTVFFFADKREELSALPALAAALPPGGCLWIVRPKGITGIPEKDVIDSGRAAGLVDIKVVRFSDALTAQKFVPRKADRAKE